MGTAPGGIDETQQGGNRGPSGVTKSVPNLSSTAAHGTAPVRSYSGAAIKALRTNHDLFCRCRVALASKSLEHKHALFFLVRLPLEPKNFERKACFVSGLLGCRRTSCTKHGLCGAMRMTPVSPWRIAETRIQARHMANSVARGRELALSMTRNSPWRIAVFRACLLYTSRCV